MDQMVQQIIDIMKECSQIMLEAEDIVHQIEVKEGKGNFVTVYDKRIQQALQEKLSKLLPQAYFMGEEDETTDSTEHIQKCLREGYAFIVDPIDGTTNFMKGVCHSCISVGLLLKGAPYIGVVYNPYLNEVFYAQRGEGAYRNDVPIHVSEHTLEDGIAIFGTTPYYEELSKLSFEMAYRYFCKCQDVRRSGSAALDLCSIACGRAEVFFELRICPWDYAAGALLVTEAGGVITDMSGKPLQYAEKTGVLASGAVARRELTPDCYL